jgi:hypothetical protein
VRRQSGIWGDAAAAGDAEKRLMDHLVQASMSLVVAGATRNATLPNAAEITHMPTTRESGQSDNA